jgi:hypothetical protein
MSEIEIKFVFDSVMRYPKTNYFLNILPKNGNNHINCASNQKSRQFGLSSVN